MTKIEEYCSYREDQIKDNYFAVTKEVRVNRVYWLRFSIQRNLRKTQQWNSQSQISTFVWSLNLPPSNPKKKKVFTLTSLHLCISLPTLRVYDLCTSLSDNENPDLLLLFITMRFRLQRNSGLRRWRHEHDRLVFRSQSRDEMWWVRNTTTRMVVLTTTRTVPRERWQWGREIQKIYDGKDDRDEPIGNGLCKSLRYFYKILRMVEG